VVTEITGALLCDMIVNAAAAIENNKQQLNELNVFPVPDGDTGTNMSMTIGAGALELRSSRPDTVTQAADKAAAALLRGARGNSGVILSLLFRGMSKSIKGKTVLRADEFADALKEGVNAAYSAVMKPKEGTILTVSRVCADAAVEFAAESDDVEAMLARILEVGEPALAETMHQNPVLEKAGVVDSGAKGYLCMISGMLLALRGEMLSVQTAAEMPAERADFTEFATEDITFGYCTEFIVGRENMKSPNVLRDFLDGLGDSIVVVDDDEIIKVHVHTNTPGAVLTEALTYGQLLTVKIENMRQQHTELRSGAQEAAHAETASVSAPDGPVNVPAEKRYGIVAVCAGAGMDAIFRDLGADAVITGGQTMNPATEDILNAVYATPAEIVYVLPNNRNIILAAQQCVGLTDKEVVVLETTSVPQGISAMLAMDTTLEPDALTETLNDAIAGVRTVQLTYAARDSEFDGQSILAGEYLAMFENTMLSHGADLAALLDAIAEKLRALNPEFLNIYYGEDVDEAAANAVLAKLETAVPEAEATLAYGGQPVYYYMISAE